MQKVQIRGFRLSPQQAHLWQLQQGGHEYRVQGAISITGVALQVSVLQDALQAVARKFSILHTTFHPVAGMELPLQVIEEGSDYTWQQVDLQHIAPEQRLDYLQSFLQAERQLPFDKEHGPLLQTVLVEWSATDYVLVISLPALCADAQTLQLLLDEVYRSYNALSRGEQIDEEEELRYVDVGEWFYDLLDSPEAAEGKEFWQKHLQRDSVAVRLPFQLAEGQPACVQPKLYALPIPETLLATGKLGDDARTDADARSWVGASPASTSARDRLMYEHGVALPVVFQACWQLVLARLSGRHDFLLGLYCDGRSHEELEQAVGLYGKYLPVAVHVDDQQTFLELAVQTQRQVEALNTWQDYYPWTQPGQPIATVGFAFHAASPVSAHDWHLLTQYSYQEYFPLQLTIQANAFCWQYDSAVHAQEEIEQLARYYLTLLTAAIQQPQTACHALPILDEQQRSWLLSTVNQTQVSWPAVQSIQQLISQQAQRYPQQPAVRCGADVLSYAQLDQYSSQLAHALRHQGILPGQSVGLCLPRSTQMIVALLAVLKAGASYVPLDPDHPLARWQHCLQQAEVQLVLTSSGLQPRFAGLSSSVRSLVLEESLWQQEAPTAPEVQDDQGLTANAYIISTSGSTGQPKGVPISQGSLLNYTQGLLQRVQAEAGWVWATVSTLSADLGNTAIFPALCSGGCVQIVPQEDLLDGARFAALLQEWPCDVLKIVPSHLQSLLHSTPTPQGILPQRLLILGGERLSWSLWQEIDELHVSCQVVNHYGPTEATIGALLNLKVRESHEQEPLSQSVPLGWPFPNVQAYVLDAFGELVPVGVVGELYLGGAGIAQGYLQAPEQSEQRFLPNAFGGSGRLYRTGDQVRRLKDGSVEFVGRVDEQVKVRGHRIELGEIEQVLRRVLAVRQAVVVLRGEAQENPHLVAYLVGTAEQQQETSVQVKRMLQEYLPEVMIPSAFVWLRSLPLTSNGKVDRAALPALEMDRSSLETLFVAPRTVLEAQLATIWSELLGVQKIGIDDNFFLLGGHSMLVVRLLEKIQQRFQQSFPLGLLFQAPTIRQLAQVIEQETPLSWSSLVCLQPQGRKRPLFCVHSIASYAYSYIHLARHLGNDQPLYCFQDRGLDGQQPPFESIEEMAANYVATLQTIQPTGPYQLAGHSLGGVIAFEMALQLRLQGQDVSLLAVMDTGPLLRSDRSAAHIDPNELNADDDVQSMLQMARIAERFWGKTIPLSVETLHQLTEEERLSYFLQQLEAAGALSQIAEHATVPGLLQVLRAARHSRRKYHPRQYDLPIALFCTSESASFLAPAWQEFATQQVQLHIVPGDHVSMLTEPSVQTLASMLEQMVNK